MPMSAFARAWFAAAVVVWLAAQAVHAQTQQPVNSGANPYRVIRDWAQLTKEQAVGRLQRRRHRPRRQVRVGHGSLLAWHRSGLSRHKGEPRPPLR